jgi:putative endonuclease
MNSVSSGQRAEMAVAEYLTHDGYSIRQLNWKTSYAEIDIVAQKGNTIFFVEVKFRSSESAGDGFDYITSKKLHHMQRAAEAWVVSQNWQGDYDLLAAAVLLVGNHYQIDVRPIH